MAGLHLALATEALAQAALTGTGTFQVPHDAGLLAATFAGYTGHTSFFRASRIKSLPTKPGSLRKLRHVAMRGRTGQSGGFRNRSSSCASSASNFAFSSSNRSRSTGASRSRRAKNCSRFFAPGACGRNFPEHFRAGAAQRRRVPTRL